nr:MAG TPA: hypothetical protein [Caudoviricetes sp.]
MSRVLHQILASFFATLIKTPQEAMVLVFLWSKKRG